MREFFFNLVWLIPLFPLMAFALIVLWTNRNRLLSTWIAWIGIGLSWLLGWTILFLTWQDIEGLTPPLGNHRVPLYSATGLPGGYADQPDAAHGALCVSDDLYLLQGLYELWHRGCG